MIFSITNQYKRFLRFMIVGAPAFILAVPLNIFLVEFFGFSKPAAYGSVLVFQVFLNFELCRRFVFPESRPVTRLGQFLKFTASILLFRLLDWAFYSYLTSEAPQWYVWFQILNVALFSVLKFLVSRSIFFAGGITQKLLI